MKKPLKYANFYKCALLRGCVHGMKADENLVLHLEDASRSGAYLTPMFDTGEEDGTYNRLCIRGEFSGAKLEVIVAAADERNVILDGEQVDLKEYLGDPQVSADAKAEVLTALPHIRMVNTQDILLHELQGRYAWAYVGMIPDGTGDCSLEGLRLEFPRYSFTEYFPEIYQEDPFFDRYIAVFQSMYLDAERRIDEVPAMLDYESADSEGVEKLAGWLGIDNRSGRYSVSQLRQLIRENDLFQGGKGTRVALEEIIALITGIRPKIVEHFQWDTLPLSAAQRKLCGELYGKTSNHFCVILDLTHQTSPLPVSREELEKLINAYSMIGIQHKLVYLRKCSHTDDHCYLDVNSCLSVPEIAAVDGITLGSHVTVG